MAQQAKPAEQPQQQQQQSAFPAAQPGQRGEEQVKSPQQGAQFSDWASI